MAFRPFCLWLVALLLLPACAASHAAGDLRVLCWNIHHGAGLDGRIDVDRIARVIRKTGADVVALQEVDRGVRRSGRLDLPAELARRLGMRAVFGKNLDYQGGDYGNAILTKLEVVRSYNHHFDMVRPDEQRGCLVVHLRFAGRPLVCAVTHLGTRDADERLQHAREILGELGRVALATPIVLAGDFNDYPNGKVHARLTETLVDVWEHAERDADGYTFPAKGPKRRIDWLLLTPRRGLSVVGAEVVVSDASDHCGLLARFVRRADQ